MPTRNPDATADVVGPTEVLVVGLGAAGLTCCLELARAGVNVVGVDAVGVGAGASGRNGGFLLAGLALFHHDAVATLGRARADTWYRATLDELDRTFSDEPTAIRTGSVRVAGPDLAEPADIEAQRDALEASGFPVERHAGPHGTGIRLPSDGQYEPLARCHRLAETALAAGARLATTRVHRVETGGVVDEKGRTREAPAIVVAVDGGLDALLPSLSVRSARLQMAATGPAPHGTVEQPVYRRYGLDYLRQAQDGPLHVGGGRDLEGDDAWTLDATTTPDVQSHLDDLAGELVPGVAVMQRWSATSGFTPDRMPICTTGQPGVHVIGGYSGHGNIIGPLLARHVARAITTGADAVSPPF